MLRFQFNNRYPDYLSKEKLHFVTARNTIFGVHKPSYDKDTDPVCTRTNLVTFVRKDDATSFLKSLDEFQNINKYIPDRILDGTTDEYRRVGPLLSYSIESIDAIEMETLCRIHGFHMMVVHNIQVGENALDDIYECYLFETPLPTKPLLVKYFKNMYRKST